jgi:hypothetical protein
VTLRVDLLGHGKKIASASWQLPPPKTLASSTGKK